MDCSYVQECLVSMLYPRSAFYIVGPADLFVQVVATVLCGIGGPLLANACTGQRANACIWIGWRVNLIVFTDMCILDGAQDQTALCISRFSGAEKRWEQVSRPTGSESMRGICRLRLAVCCPARLRGWCSTSSPSPTRTNSRQSVSPAGIMPCVSESAP